MPPMDNLAIGPGKVIQWQSSESLAAHDNPRSFGGGGGRYGFRRRAEACLFCTVLDDETDSFLLLLAKPAQRIDAWGKRFGDHRAAVFRRQPFNRQDGLGFPIDPVIDVVERVAPNVPEAL